MTTDRDRLAALLAHHADVVAARWDSVAPSAGAWEIAAAHSLRGHAAALVADEETPAVRELLDSFLAFEAEHPAAPAAPADRAASDYEYFAALARQPETDEQRTDRLETERDHAAGNHEHCGVTCEVQFPTEQLRNFVIIKGYPGTAGMLHELLRRAREEGRREPAAAPSVPADTIGLCGYCGVPRETHHHGYVSTAAALAAAPHRITAEEVALGARIEAAKKQVVEEQAALTPVGGAKGNPFNYHSENEGQRKETVHGCPPDGSGLTPCCGRTPFELPLGHRISTEAPTTCTGPAKEPRP